ncbi:hypothetical protein COV12_03145, partial [Candidatus Woesearchaeota archaeon CG10_big_fil_rev_8_21_14_0_10_32_24]
MSLDTIIKDLEKKESSFRDIFPVNDKYIQKIFSTKDGSSKLRNIANISDLLFRNEFNSFHCFSIVVGVGWEEKLEWINQNYETLLKPMEFNGSHVS